MGSAGRTRCTGPRRCSSISRPAPLFQIEPVICGHLQRLLINLTKSSRRPDHQQFTRRGRAGHGSNFGLISAPPTASLQQTLGGHSVSEARSQLALIAGRPFPHDGSRPQRSASVPRVREERATPDFDQMARAVAIGAMVIVRRPATKWADPIGLRARETRLAGLYCGAF